MRAATRLRHTRKSGVAAGVVQCASATAASSSDMGVTFPAPITPGSYVVFLTADFNQAINQVRYDPGSGFVVLDGIGYNGPGKSPYLFGAFIDTAGVSSFSVRSTGGGAGHPIVMAIEVAGVNRTTPVARHITAFSDTTIATDATPQMVVGGFTQSDRAAPAYSDTPSAWSPMCEGFLPDANAGTVWAAAGGYVKTNAAGTAQHLPNPAGNLWYADYVVLNLA